jgi:hypothetical protein
MCLGAPENAAILSIGSGLGHSDACKQKMQKQSASVVNGLSPQSERRHGRSQDELRKHREELKRQWDAQQRRRHREANRTDAATIRLREENSAHRTSDERPKIHTSG